MNEFSQLLQVIEDLDAKVRRQQLQINTMRDQVAELSEQLYGHTEQQPAEDQASD
ncbi:hypothetical protein [Microbulbifer sp. JSM ZJ756]|uniref:hypothetical protein n=1 Tax=Microbulbifer sp. JSM ZJ756 TaxID=3376191 RepID=UPI003789C663